MSNFNLDELLEQKAEATGSKKGRVSFDFTARDGEHKGEVLTFTIRDSTFMTDEEWDELSEITADKSSTIADIADFWMGDEESDRFAEAGGTPMMIVEITKAKVAAETGEDAEGRPTQPNRSSRRAAARKRRKQR